MTQHMGFMDLSDEEDKDEEPVVGYVEVLSPASLGWHFKEFKGGETTVGRTDDRDVTISDPSVSGTHAAIDVVELPGGGGKRLTLKDLRSTNGTYIVDAVTGDKTRLAPRKVTMLPEEGCRVHFGRVECKVAMGPAPGPPADNEEAAAAEAGVYDNDTQLPGAIDDDVDNDVGEGGSAGRGAAVLDSTTGEKESGTEPLAILQEGEEKRSGGGHRKAEAVGGGSGAQGGKPETEVRPPGTDGSNAGRQSDGERQNQGVEETKGEGGADGRGESEGPSPSRVRFDGVGPMHGEEGGGGAEAENDEAGVEEPPTQGMALEIDDSDNDTERDQKRGSVDAAKPSGGGAAGVSADMALEIDDGVSDPGQEGKSAGAAANRSGDDAGARGSADMALELDDSGSDNERDGKGVGAASVEQAGATDGGGPPNPSAAGRGSGGGSGAAADPAAAAPAGPALSEKGTVPANSGEDTADEGDAAVLFQKLDEESDGQKDKVSPAAGAEDQHSADADDTADEGDTALLFDDQDEYIAKGVVDAGAGASASSGAPRSPEFSAPAGLTTEPVTPPTMSGGPGGEAISPGNASEGSTQRQEGSPRVASQVGEGSVQQKLAAAPLVDCSAPAASAGGSSATSGGASARQGAGTADSKVGGEGDTNSVGGDEEGSDSSGALIPAEDLDGIEDDLLTAPDTSEAHADDAGDIGAGDGAGGPPNEDDSGSETDATEVDTDDGAPPGQEPKLVEEEAAAATAKPTSSSGIGEAKGKMAPLSTDSAGTRNKQSTPPVDNTYGGSAGDVGAGAGAGASAVREQPSTPEATRSPGGSLLRRTFTEDAMMAIAREHARNEAVNMARAGAGALTRDSDEEEEEEEDEGGPGDTEVDNPDGEADTQAVPIQQEEEENDSDEENAADGTEVVEEGDSPLQQADDAALVAASPPDTAPEKGEVVASPGLGAAAASEAAAAADETVAGSTEPDGEAPGDADARECVAEAGASVPAEAEVSAEQPPLEASSGKKEEERMDSNKDGAAVAGGGADVGEEEKQTGSVERESEKEEEEEKSERACSTEEEQPQVSVDAGTVQEEDSTGNRRARAGMAAAAAAAAAAAPTRTSGRRKKATPKATPDDDAEHAHAQDVTNQSVEAAPRAQRRGTRRNTVAASAQTEPPPPPAVEAAPTERRGRNKASKSSEETLSAAAAAARQQQDKNLTEELPTRRGKRRRSEEAPAETGTAGAGSEDKNGDGPKGVDGATASSRGAPAKRGRRSSRAATAAAETDETQDAEAPRVADMAPKTGGKGVARKRKAEEAGVCSQGEGGGSAADAADESEPAVAAPALAGSGRGRVRKGNAAQKRGEHPPAAPTAVAPRPSKRGRGRPAKEVSTASEEAIIAPRTPARPTGRGKTVARSSPSPVPVATGGRSASVGVGDGESPDDVKVCFTGVKPTNKERACMKKLGVSEVDSVLEATHLVAGGSGVPLKRTPKLLAGLGRCRFVVDVEWLYQSAKEGKLLDGVEFVLCDAEAEKRWAFNMRLSLGRRPEGGLLAGLAVHVDPAVAGAKGMGCPPAEEMKMVITSAGGQWLPQIPKRGGPDRESLLVISHPDALKVSGAKGIKSRAAAAAGRNGNAYLPEMLFLCILRQKISWAADLAVGGGEGGTAGGRGGSAEKVNPAKRRRA
eukprot:g13241.t1